MKYKGSEGVYKGGFVNKDIRKELNMFSVGQKVTLDRNKYKVINREQVTSTSIVSLIVELCGRRDIT